MNSDRFIATFQAARRAGAPGIVIETPDPAATIGQLLARGIGTTIPVIAWDCCRGWRAMNEPGAAAKQATLRDERGEPLADSATTDPIGHLVDYAPKLPPKSVLFLINAHRYAQDGTPGGAAFVQALWNLRDTYKANLRSVVLLGPSFALPPEIAGDFVPLDEPLPSETELADIVKAVASTMEIEPDADTVAKGVDALRGLASFPAEQATAMALEDPEEGPASLNVSEMWERKRRMISSTPGLSVWTGGETFDQVGGCAQIKQYLRLVLGGREPPRCVVFLDELEKAMAGAQGDNTGVSQGIHGQMLTYMQDNEVEGVLEVGVPGAGKSAIAKAYGAEAGVPILAMDLEGMKASLVGESGARLRQAFKVVTAVGGGRALFIATSNRIGILSPELKRRFERVFYFDLPNEEEKAAIWRIYLKRYQLQAQALPNDAGWTGAEIKSAARMAYRFNMKLADTAPFIVPVSRTAAEEIEQLRKQADGRWLSASEPGYYRRTSANEAPSPTARPRARARRETEV